MPGMAGTSPAPKRGGELEMPASEAEGGEESGGPNPNPNPKPDPNSNGIDGWRILHELTGNALDALDALDALNARRPPQHARNARNARNAQGTRNG